MHLIDGKPMSWWLYPPYPFSQTWRRTRTLAWLKPSDAERHGRIVNEYGEIYDLDGSDDYQAVKSYAMGGHPRTGGRTIYVSRRAEQTKWWAWMLIAAVNDPGAMVSYSPTSGFRGIRWPAVGGNRASALLLDSTWGRDREPEEPGKWLYGIRRTLDYLDIGDYDTAGSMGEATLSKFWTEGQFPRLWRNGAEISDLLMKYRVGGRAEAPGASRALVYPSCTEIDLSHAYPTAVARGLPYGRPRYISGRSWGHVEPYAYGHEAVYGEWRITVHEDITFAPIPWKASWSVEGSRLHWDLPVGEYTYAGWEDEIFGLCATGQASVECLRAWVWPVLTDFLRPWVEDLQGRREAVKQVDPFVSSMMKQVNLSAIGMWGLGDPQWDVIPAAEADIRRDMPVDGSFTYDMSTIMMGAWLREVSKEPRIPRPLHWASYVRMVVRMELWRKLIHEESRGNHVLLSNFDALYLTRQPESITQGSNQPGVCAAQAAHPWTWKTIPHGRTLVPYNRAVIFPDEGIQRTPGASTMSEAMQLAIIAEGERRRAGGVWVK